MKYITLEELNLTVNDFNIEYVVRDSRTSIIKINNVNTYFTMDNDKFQYLSYNGIDTKAILTSEAINWYINNKQFIRKLKLDKIMNNL